MVHHQSTLLSMRTALKNLTRLLPSRQSDQSFQRHQCPLVKYDDG